MVNVSYPSAVCIHVIFAQESASMLHNRRNGRMSVLPFLRPYFNAFR